MNISTTIFVSNDLEEVRKKCPSELSEAQKGQNKVPCQVDVYGLQHELLGARVLFPKENTQDYII